MQINHVYENMVYLYVLCNNMNTMKQTCSVYGFGQDFIALANTTRYNVDIFYNSLVDLCKDTRLMIPTADTLEKMYYEANTVNWSRRVKTQSNKYQLLPQSIYATDNIYDFPTDSIKLSYILKKYLDDFQMFVMGLDSWIHHSKDLRKTQKDMYISTFHQKYEDMLKYKPVPQQG